MWRPRTPSWRCRLAQSNWSALQRLYSSLQVDLEEQAGFAQDVKEAVDRKLQEEKEKGEEEEDSGSEWVNHSDLESDDSSD